MASSLFPGTIVVSRDGALGLHLIEFEGKNRVSGRDAIAFYYGAILNPRADATRLAVLFSSWSDRMEWAGFGLPDIEDKDTRLVLFSEAAIGDYLDQSGLPSFTPEGAPPAQIKCFPDRTRSWIDMPRASDEEIESYIEAKVFWAWKYELASARFYHPDFLRMKSTFKSFQRLALIGEGEKWTGTTLVQGDVLTLTPTPAFLRLKRAILSTQGGESAEILTLLSAPRYAGPRDHWQKSLLFATDGEKDPANAVKEAVCAVEGLCRLITGKPTATLGELIKHLRASGRIDPALAKTLEGIWGFASNAPGVRHGASSREEINANDARLTIDTCRAALRFLMELDR